MDIDYGSTLFVDNITISENSGETAVISSSIMMEQRGNVYTITGSKRQQLKPGINIVRMSDGTYKKVFIK